MQSYRVAFSGFSTFAQMAQMLLVFPEIRRSQLSRWSNIRLHAARRSGDGTSSMRTVNPCSTHADSSSAEQAEAPFAVFRSQTVLVHVFAMAGWASLEADEQAASGITTKANVRATAADREVRMTPG
jgi:hypothetical protein